MMEMPLTLPLFDEQELTLCPSLYCNAPAEKYGRVDSAYNSDSSALAA